MDAQTGIPVQPRKKRISVGKVILLLFSLVVLLVFWFVARSGFVPGLAKVVGADKPVNLGVKSTAAQSTAMLQKLGIRLDNQPAATDPAKYRKVYSGQVAINQDFTESEISALLNFNHVAFWAVKDAQVKISKDGTLEAAMLVKTSTFNIRRDGEVPTGVMRYLPAVLPDELPVYVKGKITVAGSNQVRTDIQALQIGRVTIPASVVNAEVEKQANQYVNDRLRAIPGLSIQEISFQDGKVHFRGTWPKEFRRIPIQ